MKNDKSKVPFITDNKQMTSDKRYQISDLLERGISVSEIAKTVQCHHFGVSRTNG